MQSCSQETKMTQKSGRNKAKTKLVVRIAFAKQTPCARRARLHITDLVDMQVLFASSCLNHRILEKGLHLNVANPW